MMIDGYPDHWYDTIKAFNGNMSTPSPYVGSLLRIAAPLILSGLASNLSIFIDRAILSHYDIDMMSHVSTVSSYCWMVLYLSSGVAQTSQIFVGRFNGAKQYDMTATVAWQMIFFSIACLCLFIPMYGIAPWLLPQIAHQHGLIYFKMIMLGGIFWPLVASLCSFFIGTYQIKTIFYSLMLANATNILLDLLWIPHLGTYGAALATISAMGIQFIYLFTTFLSHHNRAQYKTHQITWNRGLLFQAIRVGYPEALSHFFEMMAWACIITLIASKGRTHMLVSNLAQNLYILFMFVYMELGNAVKSLCSNYLGEDKQSHIPRLVLSAFTLHTVFVMSITLCILVYPDLFLSAFSIDHESYYIQTLVIQGLKGVFLFMFFDGLIYILASILSAHGDTFNSMLIMTLSMWLFLVLPTYWLVQYGDPSPSTHSAVLLPLYGAITTVCYLWRYLRSPAKTLVVTSP